MSKSEFTNIDERSGHRSGTALLGLGLVLLVLLLLVFLVVSGTGGQVDVSIPTRLFPGT